MSAPAPGPAQDWPRRKAQLAAQYRHHGAHDPKVVALAAQYKADRLEEAVRRVVAEAPPLTAEQKTRLAALLLVGGGAT